MQTFEDQNTFTELFFIRGEDIMISATTLDRLRSFRLIGLIDEIIQQEENSSYRSLDFDQRLTLLVDAEYARRTNVKAGRLMKQARVPRTVSIDDVNFVAKRNLSKQTFFPLLQEEWLKNGQTVIITGATGLGKTFLASVVTHHLCRRGVAVRYQKTHRWLTDFLLAEERRRFSQTISGLKNVPLLIFDEWLRDPISTAEARLLLDLIDNRYQQRSVMLLSQFPVADWHSRFADPTLADAILDRLIHNACRFELKGETMRKNLPTSDLSFDHLNLDTEII